MAGVRVPDGPGRWKALDGWERALAELADLLRWNSGERPPRPPLSQEEAEGMAREVMERLLAMPDELYPKQVGRRGLRFILHEEPGDGGPSVVCTIWDGERWRELGSVAVPGRSLPGGERGEA